MREGGVGDGRRVRAAHWAAGGEVVGRVVAGIELAEGDVRGGVDDVGCGCCGGVGPLGHAGCAEDVGALGADGGEEEEVAYLGGLLCLALFFWLWGSYARGG